MASHDTALSSLQIGRLLTQYQLSLQFLTAKESQGKIDLTQVLVILGVGKYGFDVLVDEPSQDVTVRCLGPGVENVAVRGKRSEICGGAFQLTGGIVNYKHLILRCFKGNESRPSQSERTQFQS